MAHGEVTLSEINSQPRVWLEALNDFERRAAEAARFWSAGAFDQILLTGCGSTYYLGMMGASLLEAMTGIPARALSASELMLYPEIYFPAGRRTLFIGVSRSGTTRETVQAARAFRAGGGGSVAVVTCDSRSPLAQEADLLLAIDSAQEQSRVQTRSFSSMGVVLTALAAALGGQDWRQIGALPEALTWLLANVEGQIRPLSTDIRITQFVFLGSGARYALACEAMLKMTEMSRVFSAAYHTLEYLHGPRYAADAGTLVVGLLSEAAYAEEIAALQAIRPRRARVIALAEADQGEAPEKVDLLMPLSSGVPEWARAILYLPPLQLLGWHQAVERGFDPDNLPYDPRDRATS
ncbi:MAG: SIS domain-containing protein [Anaerolineae bacterium]|nr:SIS domain-containing protein [Anaerolineae bacterium]